MRLTIITINYNSSENTIKLLESLKDQTDKDFEIIVVDNNSNSEEKAKLKNHRTEETNIIFIENNENFGYSGGNNVGIRRALNPPAGGGSDWILLLNNDTWVDSDFISRLRASLESKESMPAGRQGIVGIAIDEGEKTAYAGQIQWLRPTLSHITMFNIVSPQVINKNDYNDVQHRYYAIGGAMFIPKDVFDKIGFLDENYFLYFEDADFCRRAREAGIPISFLPEIKIYHSVSASTKKLGSPMLLRYHYRNALYFNLKNGPWFIKLLVWPWSWLNFSKQVFKIIINRESKSSKAILLGIIDFYLGRFGKIVSSI